MLDYLASLYSDEQKDGEFTSAEFAARIGLGMSQAKARLQKLILDGMLTRRMVRAGRVRYFYKLVEK